MQDTLSTVLIVGSLMSATFAFIWVAIRLGNGGAKADDKDPYTTATDKKIDQIFNDEFREELRNRGRLHFEKIIGENAMFLQQDLRLTTSQINEHMKSEITKSLEAAFANYEESLKDAKEMALQAIDKTQASLEEQRKMLDEQLKKASEKEKQRVVGLFENNLADIVNHYVLSAIGDQITLDDQLEYILAELEKNKDDIIKDIESGA